MPGRLLRLAGALWAGVVVVAILVAAVFGFAQPTPAFARGFGPFSGKVELVLLTDSHGPVTRAGRTLWGVVKPVTYTTRDGETITVPKGMVTDLASIPAPFAPLLPPDGPWVSAAVVHDYLYETRGSCDSRGHIGRSRPWPYSRAEADLMLHDAMEDLGLHGWRVWVIYEGVRLGGAGGWGH